MIHQRESLVEIDGAQGEGGGQVLRSALTLSAITGNGVHLYNIRSNRSKPGLMAQHLKSVDAAAAVCKASVDGASMNSTALTFQPSGLRSGRYRFEIGTAGATSLVLQTIFLPLSLTSSSSVIISGGTHVPWSPCYHYLALHWLPTLQQMGFDAQVDLEQAGFYPSGGGRIQATIRHASAISPLRLIERGKLLHVHGISAVANLPTSIADRQKRQAVLRLQKSLDLGTAPELRIQVQQLQSPAKGTFLLLLAEFEAGRCCYFGLGALGKPAERVADEAVDSLLAFLDTDGAIDQYLADQLLIPLSLANGPSELRTSRVTPHLLTNAAVLHAFLPTKIEIDGEVGQPGQIRVLPGETVHLPGG